MVLFHPQSGLKDPESRIAVITPMIAQYCNAEQPVMLCIGSFPLRVHIYSAREGVLYTLPFILKARAPEQWCGVSCAVLWLEGEPGSHLNGVRWARYRHISCRLAALCSASSALFLLQFSVSEACLRKANKINIPDF